jgi:hypothetical protein
MRDRDAREIVHAARRERETSGDARKLRIAINIAAAVVILALVAFTAMLALRPPPCGSRVQTAKIEIAELRMAVQLYLVENLDDCPSLERLVEAGIIDAHRRMTDPWDREYAIRCVDGETIVTSNGPDGLPDTEDDVR